MRRTREETKMSSTERIQGDGGGRPSHHEETACGIRPGGMRADFEVVGSGRKTES